MYDRGTRNVIHDVLRGREENVACARATRTRYIKITSMQTLPARIDIKASTVLFSEEVPKDANPFLILPFLQSSQNRVYSLAIGGIKDPAALAYVPKNLPDQQAFRYIRFRK